MKKKTSIFAASAALLVLLIAAATLFVKGFERGFNENHQERMEAITPRFLALIQHIDALGFGCDFPKSADTREVDPGKYVRIEFPRKSTVTMRDHPDVMEADIRIEKVRKIAFYSFKQKKSKDGYYIDGVIEEWTFADKSDAQKATQELLNVPLSIVYFNTGAYVCCVDKQMYIFRSRAAMFMFTQRKFYQWFVKQNAADLSMETSK